MEGGAGRWGKMEEKKNRTNERDSRGRSNPNLTLNIF